MYFFFLGEKNKIDLALFHPLILINMTFCIYLVIGDQNKIENNNIDINRTFN